MPKLIIVIICVTQISCSGIASFAISAAGNIAGDWVGKKIGKTEMPNESDIKEKHDD